MDELIKTRRFEVRVRLSIYFQKKNGLEVDPTPQRLWLFIYDWLGRVGWLAVWYGV